MSIALPLFFLITALIYAMVGFGGGSTYAALLSLSAIDYRILPIIALSCNILVVLGGSWAFARAGHITLRQALPFFLLSVPAAFIGGAIAIPQMLFLSMLASALIISGALMVWQEYGPHRRSQSTRIRRDIPLPVQLSVGGFIGLFSGMVGIGGGIFLSPILHHWRWQTAQKIAATASLFILVNSVAGLIGQIVKRSTEPVMIDALGYWPLLLAVIIGGQIGSQIGSRYLPERPIKTLTGVLVAFVGCRILWQVWAI